MDVLEKVQNWEIGTSPEVFRDIAWQDVNVVIYERDIDNLKEEIELMLPMSIEIRCTGTIEEIMTEFRSAISELNCVHISDDIEHLLNQFRSASGADSFRLLFETVTSNMCRRFHSDMNDLRMLCTYAGPGTLWLKDDNINRDALNQRGEDVNIVKNETEIQQLKTGAAVILKGAMYAKDGTKAAVHKSPPVEETGEKRLMLRIDVNENLFI
ncbi:MAG: hypothetical protein DCO96_12450 [Fluviicola sp. XM-24bin1]|nr:MAG: hypothetical protein DCO96_12450 [Fluviicola sp. XM-24bin1]